jgi:hypothetical protein
MPPIRIGTTDFSSFVFWIRVPDGTPISLMGLVTIAN